MLALGVPVGQHQPKKTSWVNHPAAKIWRGHELALCHYGEVVCREWRARGYKDSLLDQFKDAYAWMAGRWVNGAIVLGVSGKFDPSVPSWLGMEEFHASHRSNLLRKDAQWYGRFGWSEPNDLPYVWPIQQEAMV